jgi:hypothetical protein
MADVTPARRVIATPRVDVAIARYHFGVDEPIRPSGYTVYVVLWDGSRHSADWFARERESVASALVGSESVYDDAIELHAVELEHHEICPDAARVLSDDVVARQALERLRDPIPADATVTTWASVQAHVSYDMGIYVHYQALFLRTQGPDDVIDVGHLIHDEDLHVTRDTLERDGDERFEVTVPSAAFRAAYARAIMVR